MVRTGAVLVKRGGGTWRSQWLALCGAKSSRAALVPGTTPRRSKHERRAERLTDDGARPNASPVLISSGGQLERELGLQEDEGRKG